MAKKKLTARQRYFSYPSSKASILGAKGVAVVHEAFATDNIVEIVENLEANERLVVKGDKGDFYPEEYKDQNDFFKHGKKVRLARYKSLREAGEGRLPFWQQRQDAFDSLDEHVAYSRYGWERLGKKGFFIVSSLIESLEAAKSVTRALRSTHPDDRIHINPYEGSDLEGDAEKEGQIIIANMHSRTGRFWHQPFKISGVPKYDNETMYALIRKLESNHNCGKTTNRSVYFRNRKTGELAADYMCHHIVAAYIRIMQEAQKAVARVYRKFRDEMSREGSDPERLYDKYGGQMARLGVVEQSLFERMPYAAELQMNPFALPTQKVVDFYLKLRTQVMFHGVNPKTGRKQFKPLDEAQIEKTIWDFVKKYGGRTSFFATSKFRNYNWTAPAARK